jgi:hypothetical protein
VFLYLNWKMEENFVKVVVFHVDVPERKVMSDHIISSREFSLGSGDKMTKWCILLKGTES